MQLYTAFPILPFQEASPFCWRACNPAHTRRFTCAHARARTHAAPRRPGRLRFDSLCKWPISDLDVWQVRQGRHQVWRSHIMQAAALRQIVACEHCGAQGMKIASHALSPPPHTHVHTQVMLRLNTPFLTPPPGGPASHAGAAAAAGAQPPVHYFSTAAAAPAPAPGAAAVITASHFLPHPALPSSPGVPELRKAVGCGGLLTQLAALHSDCHVFGHTHINGCWQLPDPLGSACSAPSAAVASDGNGGGGGGERRYVQYALEVACARAPPGQLPGLCCVFDGRVCGVTHTLVDVRSGRPLP